MYHLVYTSRARQPFDQVALEELLQRSRRVNRELTITGLLLYLNGKFMQVLEGDKKSVQQLYEQIAADPRHFKVTVVLEGESKERIFKEWSMGFRNLSDHEFHGLSGFHDIEDFFATQRPGDSGPVFILLDMFYQRNLNDYPETVG